MPLLSDRAVVALQLAFGALVTVFVMVGNPEDGGPQVFISIANRIAEGQIPYRDFPLEYPPLALVPLALPRLAGAGEDQYGAAFFALSLAFTLGAGAAVAALSSRGFAVSGRDLCVGLFAALVLAASPSVISRFDILPAFMTALALLAVAWRQPGWAGVALAIGTGAKLYPAFLLPIFLAYYVFERRWRSAVFLVIGFALPTLAILVSSFIVAGPGALSYLSYQGERGIEVESVVGGLVMLADVLGGPAAHTEFGFGAAQVVSPVVDALAAPGFLFQIGCGIALLVGGWLAVRADLRDVGRIRPRTLVVYTLAALLLVMLANKVLSNQYIVWLLPFGALLPLRQSALLLAICALTTFVYPMNFRALLGGDPWIVVALNLRNALLLVLFVWLLVSRPDRDDEWRESERRYVGDASN